MNFDEFKIMYALWHAEVGREDIFKLAIRNESLHRINNDNDVRVVNFTTSTNVIVKSTTSPYCNIYKYTLTYPDCKTHNHFDNFLMV
jgi:hypothetical protein